MTKNEKNLASKMLDMASDSFGNKICNDVPDDFYSGWSNEDRQKFVKEYHEWNGDLEEYDPKYSHLPDFAIMSFLAKKLISE